MFSSCSYPYVENTRPGKRRIFNFDAESSFVSDQSAVNILIISSDPESPDTIQDYISLKIGYPTDALPHESR
jgi:hypothetical protein